MMAALNELFKSSFWLPRKTFNCLKACYFSVFPKLFLMEVKVKLLWWNLGNSYDLKLLKLKFLYSRYIKTLDTSFSIVLLIINEMKWLWLLRPVCLKEYLLSVNIKSIQKPFPLKQVFPFTRLIKLSLN